MTKHRREDLPTTPLDAVTTEIPKVPIESSSIANEDSKNKNRIRRVAINGTKVAGILAITAAVAQGSTFEHNTGDIRDTGFAPAPPVSTMGSEMLVNANNAIRDYGPYGIALGLVTFAGYEVMRRRKGGYVEGLHDITHDSSRRNRAIFAGAVMGIVASASGLGATAGESANEPIRQEAALVGADLFATPLVTQYDNVPFNPSAIDFEKVNHAINEIGGVAVPFMEGLGTISNPTSKNAPASAPILALPNSVTKSLGIDLPPVESCDDLSVVIGEELGANAGDTVMVNGQSAHVAKTIDTKPGMGRVSVITSVEQAQECLFPEVPMSGAIALGIDGKRQELTNLLRTKYNVGYSVRNFDEYQKSYEEFWDTTVTPASMNLILDVLLIGGIAIANMQGNEILARRKRIGVLASQGVSKKDIKRAYTLANQRDAIIATPVFAATTVGFTALNNSSMYGFEQYVNLSALGAGFGAFAATSLIASWRSNRAIDKTNVAKQLRSAA